MHNHINPAALTMPQPRHGAAAAVASAAGALQSLLEAARPIAFNVNFARITGDAKAALFLSQLVYWTRRGSEVLANDGWIFKTREQWQIETGLTRHEQLQTQSHLVRLGLIELLRTGAPARNCYRVVVSTLGSRLAQLVKGEPVQWSLFDIRQQDNARVKVLFGRQFAFYRMLTDLTGSSICAIYLGRAIAIQQRMLKAQDPQRLASTLPWDQQWFHMAIESTAADTGLTAAQQRGAKHKLCQLGVFDEAMLTYPRKQLFLRINVSALLQRLKALSDTPSADELVTVTHSPALYKWLQRSHVDSSDKRLRCSHTSALYTKLSKGSNASANHPTGCENRTTRNPVSERSDIRFSLNRCPVLARPASGFSIRESPFLAHLPNTYARTTHTQRLHTDYKQTTTTTAPTLPKPSEHGLCSDSVRRSEPVVVVSEQQSKTGIDQQAQSLITSKTRQLIWPDGIDANMRVSALRILIPHAKTGQLDNTQNLIDEWAGCMANRLIRSPLSYLRQLLKNHQETPGGLVWEQALVVQQRRHTQQVNQERLALVRQDQLAITLRLQSGQDDEENKPASQEVARAYLARIRATLAKPVTAK